MRARIPYVLVGDVGFYERAEIKDVLALLRLCATPEDRQSDEAFRRVVNVPARGFGAKALQEVENEAAWRQVPLLTALENRRPAAEDTLSRACLRGRHQGRGSGPRVRHSLIRVLAADWIRPATARCCATARRRRRKAGWRMCRSCSNWPAAFTRRVNCLDHAALSTSGPKEGNADQVRLMTPPQGEGARVPARLSAPPGRRARFRLTMATFPRSAGSRMWQSRVACGG